MRGILALAVAAALCAGAWAEEGQEELPETKRVLGLHIPATWDGSLELGYSASRGNTRSDDLRFAALARQESERRRTSLDSAFDWSTSKGDTSEHKFTAGALRDWLVPSQQYFYFAEGRYDWDRFQDWDYRFSGRVGMGYDFFRTEELRLTGRAGIGATEGVNDGRSWDLEGSVGADGRWRPRDGIELGADSTFYAALNNTRFADPFRVVSAAYCLLRSAAYEQISIRLFTEHEYRSRVGEDTKKNDVRWGATVVYSF